MLGFAKGAPFVAQGVADHPVDVGEEVEKLAEGGGETGRSTQAAIKLREPPHHVDGSCPVSTLPCQ